MTTTLVKTVLSKLVKPLLALAGVIVALGLIAPIIGVPHPIATKLIAELENSLGRKIEVEEVSYSLFPAPGFSLTNVTIYEDPRYGLEPFGYVDTLQVRLRIDKLLLGRYQFSNLRLVAPSLNLVKRSDGTWNVVELVDRLGAPRRMPLNLFPAVELSDARIDFKFGSRKTTLYLLDADLSLYPERSGKLYIRFSGSPARTDRAGNGFGHIRGTANWHLQSGAPNSDQLQADIILDPSNLSELTTLFEGYDIGVHGDVSSEAHIEGPTSALRVSGELRLEDVHRWDLLPSKGEDWRIRYRGSLDVLAHRLDLETIPWRKGERAPVTLQVRASDFLTQPSWSVFVRLAKAPAGNLLPLGKRMGLAFPEGLGLTGALDGVIGYSNRTGFDGGVQIAEGAATLPDFPPLQIASGTSSILGDCIHFDLALVQNSFEGTVRAAGDYFVSRRQVVTSLTAENVSVKPFNRAVDAWFGLPPSGLGAFEGGGLSGQITYSQQGSDSGALSGQIQVRNALLSPAGLAFPVKEFSGHIVFAGDTLDANRFTASLGNQSIQGDYHFNRNAKYAERLRLELRSLDLADLEAVFEPTLKQEGLLARLRFGRRAIPPWMSARDLEAEVSVGQLFWNRAKLGSARTHLVWEGANVEFTALQLKLSAGLLRSHGSVDLAGYSPRYRFAAALAGFPWKGGLLNADGTIDSSGVGLEVAKNFSANGTFAVADVSLSSEDTLHKADGAFGLSFEQGWPNLHLSNIQADDGEDTWTGRGASQSDGRLIVDLEHDGHPKRVISTLEPETPAASAAVNSGAP